MYNWPDGLNTMEMEGPSGADSAGVPLATGPSSFPLPAMV